MPFIEDDYPLIEFPNLEITPKPTRTTTKTSKKIPLKTTTKQKQTKASSKTMPFSSKPVTTLKTQPLKKRFKLKSELNGEKKRYEDDYLVIVDDEDDSSLNLANVYAIMINENNETDYAIDSMNIGEEKSVDVSEAESDGVGFSDYDEDADYEEDDDDDDEEEDYDEDDEDYEDYDEDDDDDDENDEDVETYEEDDIGDNDNELLKLGEICKYF